MKQQKMVMAIGSPNYHNGIPIKFQDILIVEFLNFDYFANSIHTKKISFKTPHRVRYCILNESRTLQWEYSETSIFSEMCLNLEMVKHNELFKYAVPLFLFTWSETSSATDGNNIEEVHLHSMIRFTIEDALFIRTNKTAIDIKSAVIGPEWYEVLFKKAIKNHENNSLFLNNHQCYYRKLFNEIEVENKFLLVSNSDDIWALTVDFYHRIRNAELVGYIPEYKDEFQAWDYWNYLFEVVEPGPEVGYISLIPTTDGKFTIKRKWYEKDTFMRREHHYKNQEIEEPFRSYIEERFKVNTIEYPAFRRVRYDVNFESLRSGHVYGIFFDHTTINDTKKNSMSQCEVEYLRSRSLISFDEQIILEEMQEITEWVSDVLSTLNVEFEKTYYSKLTFLKDNYSGRLNDE
jgi:hypothetical protein